MAKLDFPKNFDIGFDKAEDLKLDGDGRLRMIASTISDPTQIDILRILYSKGALTYSDLKSLAGFTPFSSSRKFTDHLKKLLRKSLVALNKSKRRYTNTNLGNLILAFAKQIERSKDGTSWDELSDSDKQKIINRTSISKKSRYLTFNEAKDMIQLFNFNTQKEFQKFQKDNSFIIPRNPEKAYKKHWTNWNDFLGTKQFDDLLDDAEHHYVDREYKEAIKIYDKIIKQRPIHHAALHNKALALIEIGKLESAVIIYKKILETYPNSFDTLNNLGGILIDLEKTSEAKKYLLQAKKQAPNDILLKKNLAIVTVQNGGNKETTRFVKSQLKKDPTDIGMLETLAQDYIFNHQNCKNGLEIVNKILKHDRTNPYTWLWRGICYHELGRSEDQIIDMLLVATSLDPDFKNVIKRNKKIFNLTSPRAKKLFPKK